MTGVLAALALLAAAGTLERPPAATPPDLTKDLAQIDQAIENWDTDTATSRVEALVASAPGSAEAHLSRARVRFIAGRYDEVLASLAEVSRLAGADSRLGQEAKEFTDFVRPLATLARRFTSEESEHFRVHFVDGPDRVMVGRGLEVLESCYQAVGGDFDVHPGGKVRVEIFPDADSFEKASTLTRREIETSGTIALCKFNRLMMLSPRTVLRGFPWKDTVCHEFTHYVLWKRNGPTVPIWLHEGIAKYEEIRWKGGEGSELSPFLQQVLKEALDAGTFLGFDDMHPSFAKLKNPHDVALASAEVLSVLRTVMDRGGYERLRRMLDALRAGSDWRGMFEKALDQPFERFWQSWREAWSAALKDVKTGEAPEKLVELRDPMVADKSGKEGAKKPEEGSKDATDDEPEPSEGRHARLGDILRARGHAKAAALEYETAAEGTGASALLLNRLGLTQREAGDAGAAVRAFERALVLDPEYAPTLTNLGLAHRARGDAAEAVRFLEEAAGVNPFDPRIHEALREVYGALGRKDGSERAAKDLQSLARAPGPITTENDRP